MRAAPDFEAVRLVRFLRDGGPECGYMQPAGVQVCAESEQSMGAGEVQAPLGVQVDGGVKIAPLQCAAGSRR